MKDTRQNTINKAMLSSAKASGKILKLVFLKSLAKEINKSSDYYDVVSKTDIEAENAIIKILQKKISKINILSEEKGFIDCKSEDTIVIDPLDGSSNFLLGLPHFSISLVHLHLGEPIASVVYNPILDKMYFAEKGKGAFLNGKKIKLQTKKDTAYVSINFSHKDTWSIKRKIFDKLYKFGAKRVLNNWSPNLDFCMLAEGKIRAVISKDSLIFDFAPGLLIAREAGYIDFPKIGKVEEKMDCTKKFAIGNNSELLFKLL